MKMASSLGQGVPLAVGLSALHSKGLTCSPCYKQDLQPALSRVCLWLSVPELGSLNCLGMFTGAAITPLDCRVDIAIVYVQTLARRGA